MLRKIQKSDQEAFLALSKEFYQSDAVSHPVPESYHLRAFQEMMRSDVYVDGFLLQSDSGETMGYALVSKTFSQEPGGLAIWVEELSVLPEFRGQGLGSEVLGWLEAYYPDWARIRLEVERDNTRAIQLYGRLKYVELPYYQMVKDAGDHEMG